ncbi:hypothetical protein LR48_Vigan09g179900 [Vigna angularis]|uniref:Uncharacterized protein n=1 Tax=Phaseolus angularis TaxID=3914 RepID=A0A0L9VDK4_PHAAN|nr:hypothetical protein LR48_Vigan09g179900 [Vigna angularis]
MIGEKRVVVLIDSGASHNYIGRKLTEELALKVTDTPAYCVSLGDGHRRMTRGRCEKVTVKLEEVDVEEDFYVFELGGVDVILGVAWLAKLGEVSTNWGKMTMVYKVGDKKICIRGDPSLSRQVVNARSLFKLVEVDSGAVVWNLCKVEGENCSEWDNDVTEEQKRQLQEVLQAHYPVFREFQGLPPNRNREHRIQLKEGVDPIKMIFLFTVPHGKTTWCI